MSVAGDDLHIDVPELLTARERTRDTLFTAIMWIVYLYLWVPLASLFAWWLGFEFAYDVMIRSGGASELANVLTLYGVIVGVILSTVATWSLANLLRYGKLTRRKAQDIATTAQIAEHFGIDIETVEGLRVERSVEIDFDDEGRPVVAARAGEPYAPCLPEPQ